MPLPACRDAVVLPELTGYNLLPMLQKPPALQTVKLRIELAGVQSIAVTAELFQHPETVDGVAGCMVQDMELDEINGQSFPLHDIGVGE